MKESIGLIGIGLVGTALAQNLLAGGYRVVGYDIDETRLECLRRLGGQAGSSVADVARSAERVILSLMDTDVVLRVVEAEQGILEARGRTKLIVDTSTGEPDKAAALAARLHRRGIEFLDATISGSSEQIRRCEGVFMVGGDRRAFEDCRDLFAALAEACYYLGESGSGCRAKLATNLILGLNRLALAEGLVFARELGLDLREFLGLLRVTPAYSRAVDAKGDKMLEEDFTPQSKISQHAKDLRIILEMAERSGQDLPLARLHRSLLEGAMGAGDGNLDTSAVIRQIRRMRLEAHREPAGPGEGQS
jgi:3-hydroxyisobutyrate dehydrogenase-like beta-hydroxyacid dehydrogenase